MIDVASPVEILKEAARLNLEDPLREGSMMRFPDYGQLVMTGDMHGHRRNFQRLQKYCDLANYAPRHVILHELIHEEPATFTSPDTSYELLIEAAKWKCEFPDQVHFLLSNHELAQLTGSEISKNGRVVTNVFEDCVHKAFASQGCAVVEAIEDLIRSYPLAGRTPNRVFVSHSLPGPREIPKFDVSVFSRLPQKEDLADGGAAHSLVWGRYQTENAINSLREMLDADFFICGHQPQEMGYDVLHNRMIILASEHNHGVFLTLDLAKPVTLDYLLKNIRPFAAIA